MRLHILAAALLAVASAQAENAIHWQTLGNDNDGYVQRFTITADAPFERMAFCMFKRPMTAVNPSDTLIELFPGYFAVGSARFAEVQPGDTVQVDIRVHRKLLHMSYRPDGMHLVAGGKAVPARCTRATIIGGDDQPGMIYGAQAWVVNDSLRSAWRPQPYGGIPTPKRVELAGADVVVPELIEVEDIEDVRHDYYLARIDDSGVLHVSTNSKHPQALAARLLERIAAETDGRGLVPAAVIEDWADLPYRGFMLDVARNFTDLEGVRGIIALMARYGLNIFHFHLGDDEAWRLEIPELPELTATGARRGYTTTDDVDFLKQIYSGNGLPDAADTPANGYYSRKEFVDLLRYADSLGVAIMPEFDTPGHSRAAIRAMEQRYRATGDASLRLVEDGDTSVYTSAQDYHDNTLNPALEGPYRFWDIVISSVADMYKEAGVELPAIHIGGDEVARGAWSGSPSVQALMQREGYDSQRQVHALFNRRVADIAARHGIRIAGWQEIALNHGEEYNQAIVPEMYAVNCWTNAGRLGAQMAADGYPLILSNVDYLYFDQTPTTHPEEPGLTWGGIVDEFRPLHATVAQLCPADSATQSNVRGISGTLFAETVRDLPMVQRYLLPRMLGLAERAHNTAPTLTDTEYFGALTQQMQLWADEGVTFFVRQPGVRVSSEGLVEMNEPYGFGEIRYTLDGSTPTRESRLYTGPFEAPEGSRVAARLFVGSSESVTTLL